MISLLKNLLLINNFNFKKSYKQLFLFVALFLCSLNNKGQQIANYVNNGGFEVIKTSNSQKAKYWDGIDTTKFVGLVYSATVSPYLVPLSSLTYQWPKGGSNYLITALLYKPNAPDELRGYPRNILKQTLQAGKTYCVKLYFNVTNQTPYAVDGLGIYFGDISLDTITQCDKPLTYLTPQLQYTTGFITDTLNWAPLTGTFVSSGNEKYLMLGNFKSNANTNTLLINPTNSVIIASDIIFDNVSCIDIDLPAYAGSDAWILPGDSVYIGRESDVGIDEACMWYQMPNTTTPIDTVAGLWVKPSVTTSYLVRQEVCGNVKWDLVTVYISAVGLNELKQLQDNLKVFPQPAKNEINLRFDVRLPEEFNKLEIYNSIGQLVKKQDIIFVNRECTVNIEELPNGVYYLQLQSSNGLKITKKLVKE